MNLILKKIHLDKKEFVTADYIKKHCKRLEYNYDNTIRNLLAKGYLIRIFKGIFYVKTFDEVKMGNIKYSHHELVAKGLELKVTELENAEQAQNAPSIYATFNLVSDGKLLADHYISSTRFLNVINKELK